MLLSKQYSANDIVCFKMVNGDEVVAKIVSASALGWLVSKPCTVVPSPQGLALMQSLFSADINKDVELKNEHIMFHAPVIKQLEDHYLSTTTGIQTVSNGPIVV